MQKNITLRLFDTYKLSNNWNISEAMGQLFPAVASIMLLASYDFA
jgi:hypothetical protein